MKARSHRQDSINRFLGAALTSAALVCAAPAWAQISSVSVATNAGNSADSATTDGTVKTETRSQVAIVSSTSTSLSTRYAATVNTADGHVSGFPPTVDPGFVEAGHDYSVQFQVSAPAGTAYQLQVNTSRVGDINAAVGSLTGCQLDPVSGTLNGTPPLSGSLNLPYAEQISSTLALSQSSNAVFQGTGTGAAVPHTLSFVSATQCTSNPSFGGDVPSASLRLGLAPSTYTFATGSYPGTPARTAANDGHFVDVTLVYCGDGTTQAGLGEQCDRGAANGGESCCSATCQLIGAGNTCRAPVGACDLPELCDGIDQDCPNNIVVQCTPTASPTSTRTATPTDTPTPAPPTLTATRSPTPTITTTSPPAPSATASASRSPTLTRTPTSAFTATASFTLTPIPEIVTAVVGPATPVTTDLENDGATPDDPVETSVISPSGGSITIAESSTAAPPVSGYGVVGSQIEISAPAATVNDPLRLVFVIADELVEDGMESTLQITRAEPSAVPPIPATIIEDCTGAPGQAVPDPCVEDRTVLPDGDVQITVLTSRASLWAVVVPRHDSVVLVPKPLKVKIARDQHVVTQKLKVRVTNADILPKKEAGHVVLLQADQGDCPDGIVVGQPDFDSKTAGPQQSITLKGGQTKTAVVLLSIDPADFPQASAKQPARCTLQLSASSEVGGNIEPSPANNVTAVELNVFNPAGSAAGPHESVLQSQPPVRMTIKDNAPEVTKTVKTKVTNGDAGEAGHDISVSVISSDCPGAVGVPAFANGQAQAAVDAGKTVAATLSVSPDTNLQSPNAKSPARCTVVLRATTEVPGNSEANNDDNTTRLVIDVVDKNDF